MMADFWKYAFTSFTLGSAMLCSIRFWWDNFDWPQLHAEERDLIAVKQGASPPLAAQ